MLALAPHVAKVSAAKLKTPVDWTLPTAPLPAAAAAEGACMRLACLEGFSVQASLTPLLA